MEGCNSINDFLLQSKPDMKHGAFNAATTMATHERRPRAVSSTSHLFPPHIEHPNQPSVSNRRVESFMKTEIRIPYSNDHFVVEAERVPALLDLPIVRISVRNQRIALTPQAAQELGAALLEGARCCTETTPLFEPAKSTPAIALKLS